MTVLPVAPIGGGRAVAEHDAAAGVADGVVGLEQVVAAAAGEQEAVAAVAAGGVAVQHQGPAAAVGVEPVAVVGQELVPGPAHVRGLVAEGADAVVPEGRVGDGAGGRRPGDPQPGHRGQAGPGDPGGAAVPEAEVGEGGRHGGHRAPPGQDEGPAVLGPGVGAAPARVPAADRQRVEPAAAELDAGAPAAEGHEPLGRAQQQQPAHLPSPDLEPGPAGDEQALAQQQGRGAGREGGREQPPDLGDGPGGGSGGEHDGRVVGGRAGHERGGLVAGQPVQLGHPLGPLPRQGQLGRCRLRPPSPPGRRPPGRPGGRRPGAAGPASRRLGWPPS